AGGKPVNAYAFSQSSAAGTVINGGTGTENFLRANQTSCIGGGTAAPWCNSTYDALTYAGDSQGSAQTLMTLGTNIYMNPAFTNTTDLFANRLGVPNCNAFTNTTQCMGWNANTNTLTTPSIISDLVPTAS